MDELKKQLLEGLDQADWLKSEVDVFEEKTEILGTRERIEDYDAFMQDPLHQWYEEAGHKLRMRDQGKDWNPDQPVMDIILRPVKVETLEEPKMDRKATKTRDKGLEESKKAYEKRAKAYGEHSMENSTTVYTDYIMSVEAAYQKKGNNDWEDDPNPLPTDSEIKLKRTMFDRKYNAEMFRGDFFGRNYEYVRSELHKLDLFLNYYGQGKPAYDTLLDGEKSRITVLTETQRLMKICFEKALQRNSVEATPTGFKLKNPNQPAEGDEDMPGAYLTATYDAVWDQELNDAIEALKTHITGSTQAYFDETKTRMMQSYTQKEAEVRDEKKVMQDAAVEEYPLVQGKFFSPFAYEAIQKFKAALDDKKYQANIEANKELITTMLGDYINMQEVLSEYQTRSKTWTQMEEDISAEYGSNMNLYPSEVRMQANMIAREKNLIINRSQTYSVACSDMEMALRHLIMGKKDLNATTYMLLRKYNYEPALEKSASDSETARLYADVYREKEALLKAAVQRRFPGDEEAMTTYTKGDYNRIVNLMRPGYDAYNDSLLDMQVMRATIAKITEEKKRVQVLTRDKQETLDATEAALSKRVETIIAPKLEAMLQFNLGDTKSITQEQLIAMQPQLIDLAMASMMMTNLGELKSDIPGLTVQEKILGKPTPDLEKTDKVRYERLMVIYKVKAESLSAKRAMLDSLRVQARAASILAASTGDDFTDPKSCMTEAEIIKKLEHNAEYDRLSEEEKGALSDADKVVLFARSEMAMAKRVQTSIEDNLARSEAIGYALLWNTTWGDTPDLMFGHLKPEVHDGTALYEKGEKRIEDHKKALLEKGHDKGSLPTDDIVAKQLYHEAEAKGDTQAMLELSVRIKLQQGESYMHVDRGSYTMAGDDHYMIKEPMFRSFASSEQLPSLRAMSSEDYNAMLGDLSAGAFLDAHSTEEEVREARERNIRGFRTYYDTIMPSYEVFFEKYGSETPDVPWMLMHFDELCIDSANIQVDNNLVEHDKAVLDKTNAKDMRLKNLVMWFNNYVGMVQVMRAKLMDKDPKSAKYENIYTDKTFLKFQNEMAKHAALVKANSVGGE